MNCEIATSNVTRFYTLGAVAFMVVLLSVASTWAATQVVNLPTTTNAIPVPRFNQQASQGWLTDVDLRVTLSFSSTAHTSGNHTHSLSSSIHFGGTTSASGTHVHSVSVPNFSGSGLTIDPVSNFNTFNGGAHSHSVNAFAGSTNSAGSHVHDVPQVSRNHLFSGAAIAPFLGSGTFNLTGSLFQTNFAGNHSHSFSVGVNSAGSHAHDFTDRWNTQTTFTFDPNDAPVAEANGAYNLIYGDVLPLSAVGTFDPDVPFGDFINQYQWDLNNDGSPDVVTGGLILNLSEATYGAYFSTPGTHTIRLRARDSLNSIGNYDFASVIIPATPGDGNGDGWVDGTDYLLWAGNYLTHPGPDGDMSDGDYNDDGWVDGLDYLLWAGNFGSHFATAVPEPGASLLLALGIACVAVGRRRAG